MRQAAGYSGTSLPRKLGLKDGQRAAFLNLPDDHGNLLEAVQFTELGAAANPGDELDFVHYFTRVRAELESDLPRLKRAIRPTGMIWVSWPKKASKVPTDITEDTIREICLPIGLVDVKVCAVDPVWSGLKLMIPRDQRALN